MVITKCTILILCRSKYADYICEQWSWIFKQVSQTMGGRFDILSMLWTLDFNYLFRCPNPVRNMIIAFWIQTFSVCLCENSDGLATAFWIQLCNNTTHHCCSTLHSKLQGLLYTADLVTCHAGSSCTYDIIILKPFLAYRDNYNQNHANIEV